ncbi:hypothetical protein MY8738_009009 [Beauveria namnaoensis]
MHDIGNPTTQPAAQPRVQFNTAPWHLSGSKQLELCLAFTRVQTQSQTYLAPDTDEPILMDQCQPRARYALSRLEPLRLPSRVMATAAPPPPSKAAGGAVERPMSAQDVHGLQQGSENQKLAVS